MSETDWKSMPHEIPVSLEKYVCLLAEACGAKNELILVVRFQKIVRKLHDESKERISALESALSFYADKNNWDDRWVESGGEGREGDVYDVINSSDVDIEEDGEGPYQTHGGRRAREVLARIQSVLKKEGEET